MSVVGQAEPQADTPRVATSHLECVLGLPKRLDRQERGQKRTLLHEREAWAPCMCYNRCEQFCCLAARPPSEWKDNQGCAWIKMTASCRDGDGSDLLPLCEPNNHLRPIMGDPEYVDVRAGGNEAEHLRERVLDRLAD